MAAACGTCAICLAELDNCDEAFLDGCFHHFHLQCVERWAAAQQEQAGAVNRGGRGGGPSLACPLCRRPFESAIYDCHDSAYRRRFFGSSRPLSAASDASGGTGSLALTAAHRRRRAAYASPLPEQQRQGCSRQMLRQRQQQAPRHASR
ncbi:E3 ubiquitin- ligase Topors-like [Chlorella sorokiniana]|uniref:E3 ubiquitin-ligase Topors-like n=1 Tax=Chlorella sorokiniana TaxID=3076 RepID=A0A2P6TCS8_CHLSO|nr:E3 ubiquitin- ligase Topors-like [Chlorella sorokiniana]|eukprot:PRW20449.1 E3 ubiquitin- ligase Topors-like [Chlorella sorokiniana]